MPAPYRGSRRGLSPSDGDHCRAFTSSSLAQFPSRAEIRSPSRDVGQFADFQDAPAAVLLISTASSPSEEKKSRHSGPTEFGSSRYRHCRLSIYAGLAMSRNDVLENISLGGCRSSARFICGILSIFRCLHQGAAAVDRPLAALGASCSHKPGILAISQVHSLAWATQSIVRYLDKLDPYAARRTRRT